MISAQYRSGAALTATGTATRPQRGRAAEGPDDGRACAQTDAERPRALARDLEVTRPTAPPASPPHVPHASRRLPSRPRALRLPPDSLFGAGRPPPPDLRGRGPPRPRA